MKNIPLKQIHYQGVTMQIPQVWNYQSEEFTEEDGTKSYSMSICAKGKDVRSIDINWGIIPEGSDAYTEACATYIEVIGEDNIDENEEPIVCFDFQGIEAHGFNIYTEDKLPCFFFCVGVPSKGNNHLLTVLVTAANDNDLQDLIQFVGTYLSIE
jgi:hypothetical protein